ncbi:MAG: prolipoprotein diacylglyceryl transferase [Verrucomicrobiota bacterium]|nr:prolipoprotein diacylglyceryl transferase [Verrucomicrobiota bacterium]
MIDPVALKLGPLTIYWYGVMVATAFASGLYLIRLRVQNKKNITFEQSSDLAIAGLVGAIIGARIFYVLTNLSIYLKDPLQIIRIDKGGLVFYGGMIGAIAVIIFLCKKHNYNIREIADLFTPSLVLGQAIGRIGCLINGCCFGKACSNFLGIHYSSGSLAHQIQLQKGIILPTATQPLAVYPTQFFSTLLHLTLLIFLLLADKKKHKHGIIFCYYLIVYGTFRFFVEFLRGDYINMYGPFTIAQIICMIIVPIGTFFLFKIKQLKT